MSKPATEFQPLRLCLLTVSDSRTAADDTLRRLPRRARCAEAGHALVERALLRDDKYALRALVSQWIADEGVDGILVTGGTGFTGRDSTPEALLPLLDKQMDGFGETVPRAQLRGDRHLQPAVARLRRPRQRHLPVLPARLDLGLPHWAGKS